MGVFDEVAQEYNVKTSIKTTTTSSNTSKKYGVFDTVAQENNMKTLFPLREIQPRETQQPTPPKFKSPSEPLTPEGYKNVSDAMKMQESKKSILPSLPATIQQDNSNSFTRGLNKFFDVTSAVSSGIDKGVSLGLLPFLREKLFPKAAAKDIAAQQAHPIAAKIGEFAGYAAPGSAFSKGAGIAAKPLLNKIGSQALKVGTQEAIAGAGMGVVEGGIDMLRGGGIGDAAKKALTYTALGGVGGAGFSKGGELLGKGLSKLKTVNELKGIDKAYEKYSNKGIVPYAQQGAKSLPLSRPIAKEGANTLPSTKKPLKVANFKPAKQIENVQAPKITFESVNSIKDLPTDEAGLTNYIQQARDAQQQGRGINLQLFAEAERLLKERKFAANSILNSKIAPEELKQSIRENMPKYEPISNKETWNNAKEYVDKSFDDALNEFRGIDALKSADDTALGEALIVKAIKDNNISEANRLAVDLAEKLTNAGQTVQAASIFKRLSPEGMLMYAQRTINKANKAIREKMGNKASKVELTENESKFITDKMAEIQNMPDGREKDIVFGQVQQLIADKIPPSISDKFRALQRINLLLNPKTMTRNVLGNVFYGGLSNVKDVVATPIDKAVSLFTKQRTTTLPSAGTQLKGLKRGAKETFQDAKLGIDTSPSRGQYELPTGRIFKNSALNKLDQLTRTGLQMGDRPFYQAAYDDALRQQMKLNKVKAPTQEMIDNATKIAQERTFQDVNNFTEAFRKIKEGLNFGNDFGIGSVAMPFIKTPANILKNAIDYSPIGIGKAINEALKINKGTFNQKTFVDNLAKSVTGTIGLVWTGYELAKRGILTGQSSKDADIRAMERDTGKSSYAFKAGDKYYTYDWMQPTSMPLAFGADMYLSGKDKNEATKTLMDGVNSAGQSLFKQSLLRGVQQLFGGYNPVENIQDIALNAGTQFVPLGSALRQVNQLTDETSRSNYSPSGITQKLVNPVKQKLPVLNRTLEPNISTLGEEQKIYQGKNNPLNILINPGFLTTEKSTPLQKEVLRLYNDSGQTIQFPRAASKTLTAKDPNDKKKSIKVPLSAKEYTQLQKRMGELTVQKFNKVISLPSYKTMNDEKKAKKLQGELTDIKQMAEKEILTRKGYKK